MIRPSSHILTALVFIDHQHIPEKSTTQSRLGVLSERQPVSYKPPNYGSTTRFV